MYLHLFYIMYNTRGFIFSTSDDVTTELFYNPDFQELNGKDIVVIYIVNPIRNYCVIVMLVSTYDWPPSYWLPLPSLMIGRLVTGYRWLFTYDCPPSTSFLTVPGRVFYTKPHWGSGWIIGTMLCWLFNSSTASGSSNPARLFARAIARPLGLLPTPFHFHSFSLPSSIPLTSLILAVPGKTLVHELHILYSHSE